MLTCAYTFNHTIEGIYYKFESQIKQFLYDVGEKY